MLAFRTATQAYCPSLAERKWAHATEDDRDYGEQIVAQRCELVFAWRSDNSPRWYKRNGFAEAEGFMQCVLCGE